MNLCTVLNSCLFEKSGCGAIDQVLMVGGKSRVCASQFNSTGGFCKTQPVVNRNGLHNSLQFMEAVGALSKDVQQQIDFAAGNPLVLPVGHAMIKKAPTV